MLFKSAEELTFINSEYTKTLLECSNLSSVPVAKQAAQNFGVSSYF